MENQYEAVFIIDPVLSDVQVAETAAAYEKLITSNKGKIVAKENWRLKKLAYPIQKKKTGFYNLIEFTLPTDNLLTVDLEMRRDERLIRHLIVRLDKDAVEWAKKRREKKKEKS